MTVVLCPKCQVRPKPENQRWCSPCRKEKPGEMLATTELEPPRESDLGNALRFVSDHRDNVRHVSGWGRWFIWNGKRWTKDETGEVVRLAKSTIHGLYAEADLCDDTKRRRELVKHALHSESEPAIRHMLTLAQSVDRAIALRPTDFDRDPWLLNTPSGTVELRTGELRPHRREDLITKMTVAAYDPQARHPMWEAFLARVLPDAELRTFVQRVAGYTLTGDVSEEKIFLIHGPTAGGKSTLLRALRETLGDYAAVAAFSTFCDRKHDGPREDIKRLEGARLVVAIEVKDGARLAEDTVKWLSGGDIIAARGLYESTSEFKPQFKIVLAANVRPRAHEDDDPLWRRILEVPFRVSIPEAERDPAVKTTLCDSAQAGAAVLAWAVAGAVDWQQRRLSAPASVMRATGEYREAMDPLRDFLRDCCVLETSAWISTAELRLAYEGWAKENGFRATLTGNAFGDRLRKRGCTPKKGDRDTRGWHGIRLRGPFDQDELAVDHDATGVDAEPDWVRE